MSWRRDGSGVRGRPLEVHLWRGDEDGDRAAGLGPGVVAGAPAKHDHVAGAVAEAVVIHQVAVQDEEVLVAGVFVRGARGAGLQPVDVEAGSDAEGVVQLEDGFSRPQGLPVATREVGHSAEVRADRIHLCLAVDPITVIHPHILRAGLIRTDRWPAVASVGKPP